MVCLRYGYPTRCVVPGCPLPRPGPAGRVVTVYGIRASCVLVASKCLTSLLHELCEIIGRLILFANWFSFGASIEMAPRRQPPRERAAPEGFVRAEDVQRIVQEALAAERARHAAPQEPAQIPEPAPAEEQQ